MDNMDKDWESADNLPVSEEMNGRMVRFIQEQTAIWEFHQVDDEGEEHVFPAPVLILDFTLRDDTNVQLILQPKAATALNGILADHWGRMWGMLDTNEVDIDLSDAAIDKLMNDIKGDDNGTGV